MGVSAPSAVQHRASSTGNCPCTTDAACTNSWTRSQRTPSCINRVCRATPPFTCPSNQYNTNGGTTSNSCASCPQGTTSPAGSSSSANCNVPTPPSNASVAGAGGLSVAALGGIGGGGFLLAVGVLVGIYCCRKGQAQQRAASAAGKFSPQRVSDWGAATRTGGVQEIPTINPFGGPYPGGPPAPQFPPSLPPTIQVFSDPQGRQYTVDSNTGVSTWLPMGGAPPPPPPPPSLPGAI